MLNVWKHSDMLLDSHELRVPNRAHEIPCGREEQITPELQCPLANPGTLPLLTGLVPRAACGTTNLAVPPDQLQFTPLP
jgi:hypothetical protein